MQMTLRSHFPRHNFRLILIDESISEVSVPKALLVAQYKHNLATAGTITISIYMVPWSDIFGLMGQICQGLARKSFYAHAVADDLMIVAFPNVIYLVHRDQPDTAIEARIIGRKFGIPDEQMRFEELFDCDHPNGV